MSLKTSKLQVYPLRGMDERYLTDPNKAILIEDMTWDSQDAWMYGGGWTRVVADYDVGSTSDERRTTPINPDFESEVIINANRPEPPGSRNVEVIDLTEDGPTVDKENPKTGLYVNYPTLRAEQKYTIEPLSFSPEPEGSYVTTTNAYNRHPGIISLHWFSQFNGGIQWLVYECTDNSLRHFFGPTAPETPWRHIYRLDGRCYDGVTLKRTVIETPWSGTHYHTFAGRVYLVNGYDEPLVFDGRKVGRAGFSGQVAPPYADKMTASLGKSQIKTSYSKTRGLGFAGVDSTYKYKCMFLNERGQSSGVSDVAGEITFENKNGTDDVLTSVVLRIPKGPKGTVARRVYRTQNMRNTNGDSRTAEYPIDQVTSFGDEYYFLYEFQDNITTTWVDQLADMHLGALINTSNYGNWPSNISRIASFKNTMFLANSQDSLLMFSAPRRPEEIPVDNVIEIGDSISGPITALQVTKNALVVFKARGIYLIKGSPSDGFYAVTLTKDVGCIASKSVREVPNQGLVFMGSDGIYLLQGALEDTGSITTVVRLSQPVDETFKRVNLSAAENVRSAINYRDRELWMSVCVDGSSEPNFLFKFHYEIGEWSTVPNFNMKTFVNTGDHRDYMILGSKESENDYSGLHAYTKAVSTKAEFTVTPKYQTTNLALGSLFSAFSVVRVQVEALSYGKNDLQLNFKTNRDLSDAYDTNLTRNQIRPLEDASVPLYGTAVWDGLSFGKHRPVPIRYDITSMHKGPVQEVQFTLTGEGSRIQILGYQLEARVGSKREVVNLSQIYSGSITR